MYTNYYNHLLFKPKEREKFRERWNDISGRENECHERVLDLMKEGGGKHFLNYDFFNGTLPTLEHDLDLRGLRLQSVVFDFDGKMDNFKGIDFSHVEFYNCTFKKAVFFSCTANFPEFYNCTFEDCAFVFFNIFGAVFEKCTFVRADFAERCSWENSKFINVHFSKCFFGPTTPFADCYFDDLTKIESQAMVSYHYGEKVSTSKQALAGYYNSFQSAYENSGAEELALKAYWEGRKSYTRHNIDSKFEKCIQMTIELISGYGIKPFRSLLTIFILFVISTAGFSICGEIELKESIIFTSGALFTFGAGSEYLKEFGLLPRVIYVGLSFLGISLVALFVTSLSNLWFRSKVPSKTVKR